MKVLVRYFNLIILFCTKISKIFKMNSTLWDLDYWWIDEKRWCLDCVEALMWRENGCRVFVGKLCKHVKTGHVQTMRIRQFVWWLGWLLAKLRGVVYWMVFHTSVHAQRRRQLCRFILLVPNFGSTGEHLLVSMGDYTGLEFAHILQCRNQFPSKNKHLKITRQIEWV